MKNLMLLWQEAANELAARCRVSTDRDGKYITARAEKEGLGFLAMTLPAFCTDFQKGLEEGSLENCEFAGFKRLKNSCMPRFLSGFMRQVFSVETGCLHDEPSIDAIWSIRQLTLMFGKIGVECTEERIQATMDAFIQCEKDVRENDINREPSLVERFRKMSSMLYAQVFQDIDEDIYYGRLVPRHGPGATADKLKGNQKFEQSEWTERLETVFPSGEYLLPNWRYHELLADLTFLEPGEERPVRVIPVPKTFKAPRLIAIEPTCMQYMQQAILSPLVAYIEKDDYLTQYIGFTDQGPNRDLARRGSEKSEHGIFGYHATLDLSEASDRVSNQLVREMVRNFPNLAEGIDATRSRKAAVPGYGVIRLSKYASMGSALTFPVEAMVFLAVIFLGIEEGLGRQITREDIESLGPYNGFLGDVRVYGDDIVVPKHFAVPVAQMLEAFGLKVNLSKSFWRGFFRESCGKEFYDGEDVSVTRVRRHLPTGLDDAQEIISAVSLRNQFYMAGMWSTAAYLDNYLMRLIPLPTVKETSPVLGRYTLLDFETQRSHPFYIAP